MITYGWVSDPVENAEILIVIAIPVIELGHRAFFIHVAQVNKQVGVPGGYQANDAGSVGLATGTISSRSKDQRVTTPGIGAQGGIESVRVDRWSGNAINKLDRDGAPVGGSKAIPHQRFHCNGVASVDPAGGG